MTYLLALVTSAGALEWHLTMPLWARFMIAWLIVNILIFLIIVVMRGR